MSKMSELAYCVDELRNAARSLNVVADILTTLFNGDAQEPSMRDEPGAITTAPPPVTLEQVRATLAEKSRDGYTAAVRDLLQKHGADKLSRIDPKEYPALLKEAEALGHG